MTANPLHERLNSPDMDQALADGIAECVRNVAERFPDRQYFAFALDCQLTYGAVSFSLGDSSDFARLATNTIAESDNAMLLRALSCGDWSCPAMNQEFAPHFEAAWPKWAELIDNVTYREAYERLGDTVLARALRQQLLNRWARLLFKLERTGAYEPIRRSTPFHLLVVDHDEEITDGIERMNVARHDV